MPRKPEPLPVNIEVYNERWRRSFKERGNRRHLLADAAILEVAKEDEFSEFAISLMRISSLLSVFGRDGFNKDLYGKLMEAEGPTIEIPVSMLMPLKQAWDLYTDPDSPVTPFDKAAGLAGEGNTRSSSSKARTLWEWYALAEFVCKEKLLAITEEDDIISDEMAISRVAEMFQEFEGFEVSEERIAKAWRRWKRHLKEVFCHLSMTEEQALAFQKAMHGLNR